MNEKYLALNQSELPERLSSISAITNKVGSNFSNWDVKEVGDGNLNLVFIVIGDKGKIIITSPNWTNPRGYMLLIMYFLFDAPITLADLHYLTPIDFKKWSKKLDMTLKWETFDFSWGNGDILIKDFKKRIPIVLSDMKLRVDTKKINNLLKWIENNVVIFNNELPHSGATGIYIYSQKNIKS